MHLTTLRVDLESGVCDAAANFEEVLGFAWPHADGEPASAAAALLERVAVADRPRVERSVRSWWTSPDVASDLLAFDIVAADGAARRLECAANIERDPAGRPRRLFVACTSVAAARSDGRRVENEQRYRTALQAGRLGSWETDYVAGTRTWSREGLDLFGLQIPDGRGHVGGPHDEYRLALHPADRHLADRYRELADREDSFETEYRIVRPDGRTVWLSGRGLVVSRTADGRAERLVSIMADITERREAQERLRLERERLELALTAGHMGAFDLDMPADVLWWSPGMYTIFGVSPDTFAPTRESVLTLLHPDERAGFVRARRQAIDKRQPFAYEFRLLRPDGKVAWVAHLGRSVYDDDGQPLRTYGIAMDVTERRLQEESLREADRQKDRFIATLAHELRNPLAPIRNSVELLRRLAGSDARLTWHGDVIDRQVTHMSHLLDDLLDVSRITRGTIRLKRRTVSLAGVIHQAIEMATPLMTSLGHRLETELAEEPILVDGDATRLTQILSNLLVNAAKYTPARGRIALAARTDGAQALVRVVDNGLGIAPERLAGLFDMFGHVDSDLERSQTGLGIGLWLAHALATMHGGTLEARSDGIGRGSEFSVRLPLASVPEMHDPAGLPERRRPERERQRLTVLIADDKVDIADSLAALLRLEGHAVHVAYSGEEAIEAARRVRPQAAVLDLGMPGHDGYEVCRALRAEPWGAAMTLIAQTGWGLAEHRRRSHDAGFDHHIVKPVEPGELIALLQRRATGP